MLPEEIRECARDMKTVGDFAAILYKIKIDEYGTAKYEITPGQLYHYAKAEIPNRYRRFSIRKKNGGLREIYAPCYQLKLLLGVLNIFLGAIYTPDECVTGFVRGRSIMDNAKSHVGHHYVFNIDLKDYFPSIPQARVWARLQLPPFNFTREIANVVAGLCCHANADGTGNALPQGAPTSPLLANSVCDKLDRRMKGVARRFGLHFSRYADDMTFSSMHNVYQEGSEFRVEMERIIVEQGFRINDKKTRLLREGRRQEVTGLTVNDVVNASRKYISDLRWLLHVWETEGYARAYAKFYVKYKKEKGYIKKGEPIMENVIGGKLNFLRMVKGKGNEACSKLFERYSKLSQIVYVDTETDDRQSYVYVQPYSMSEFQECFSTRIRLEVTSNNKVVGMCELAGVERAISISRSTQARLCPDLATRNPGDAVESPLLAECHVTLCRQKGKNFWLITEFEPRRSRCLSVLNARLDIDALLAMWERQGLEKAARSFGHFLANGNPGVQGVIPENENEQGEIQGGIDMPLDLEEHDSMACPGHSPHVS